MKTNLIFRILSVICILILIGGNGYAFSKSSMMVDEEKALRLLKDPDWKERDKIVRALNIKSREHRKVLSNNDIKNTLIELFKKESRFEDEYIERLLREGKTKREAEERFEDEYQDWGYVGYYLNLCRLVGSLENLTDTTLTLLLVKYPYPGLFIYRGKGILSFLIKSASSPDVEIRRQTMAILSLWVAPHEDASDSAPIPEDLLLDERGKLQVKEVLLRAVKDATPGIRLSAVCGLGAYPTDDVISILEDIAEKDPYYNKYGGTYPVREEAKKVLEKLKEKQ